MTVFSKTTRYLWKKGEKGFSVPPVLFLCSPLVLTPNSFGEERNSSPFSLFLTSFRPSLCKPVPSGKKGKKGRTKKQPLWFAKGGVAKQTQRGKESVKKGFYFKTISRRVAILHPFPSALSSPPLSPLERGVFPPLSLLLWRGEGRKKSTTAPLVLRNSLLISKKKTLFSPLGNEKE